MSDPADTTPPPAVPPTRDTDQEAAIDRVRTLIDALPDQIGRYRILERLGHGGMGEVYVAEQTEPIKRRVALKVIKAGMDTRQVVARFEAERQALAMMDHPNIARVFDAGTTDAGRPYFVMELVRGVPITQFCDDARLSTRQRIELLVPVCQAVQHAHQKGIIHRDIKPNNVLVTLHDGKPVPKVIDFGIAKATGTSLTDKTVYTEFRQMIGTPAYMSPEQAEMSGLDIDTRSDIYSLGVLTYELLTGTTPFDTTRLIKAGLAEIQRIIKQEDPPRPSLRISTLGDRLPTMATQRSTDAGRISKLVAGELDWIVMKALEKDRRRRYETANDLAADLNRHLAGEPIEAAPPNALYRVKKFVTKYRGPVIVVITIVAVLASGVAGTSTQLIRAMRAERAATTQRAEMERQTALLSQAASEVIGESYPQNGHSEDNTGIFPPDSDVREEDVWRPESRRKKIVVFPNRPARIEFGSDIVSRRAELLAWLLKTTALDEIHARKAQLDAAETEAYIANLALAQAAMQADRWPEARQRLSACPESKRGWEWHLLGHMVNAVRFSVPGKHVQPSPDGRTFVAYDSIQARLYNSATGRQIGPAVRLSPEVGVYNVLYKPDSTAFVLVSFWGGIEGHLSTRIPQTQWFDAKNAVPIGFPVVFNQSDPDFATISPDGAVVATVSKNVVRFWDSNAGKQSGKVLTTQAAVHWACLLTSDVLCVASDGKMYFWRIQDGERFGPTFDVPDDIAMSPNGNSVAIISRSAGLRFYDFVNGVKSLHFPVANSSAKLFFSHNGKIIATLAANELQMWDSESGQVIGRSIKLDSTDKKITFSEDDHVVMTASGMWEVRTGRRLARSQNNLRLSFGESSFLKGQGRVALVSGTFDEAGDIFGQSVQVCDQQSFDSSIVRYMGHFDSTLEALAITEDFGSVLSAILHELLRQDVTVKPVNASQNFALETLQIDANLSPNHVQTIDGNRLIIADGEATVRFLDSKTKRELLAVPTASVITRLRSSPDGTRLILDFANGTMEIWDTRDYAARQKDRDVRFNEIPAAREYMQKLLTTDTPTDKLKDAVRNDGLISSLRKLVILDEVAAEISRIESAAQIEFDRLFEKSFCSTDELSRMFANDEVRGQSWRVQTLMRNQLSQKKPVLQDICHAVEIGLGKPGRPREDVECALRAVKQAVAIAPKEVYSGPHMFALQTLALAQLRSEDYAGAIASLSLFEDPREPDVQWIDQRRCAVLRFLAEWGRGDWKSGNANPQREIDMLPRHSEDPGVTDLVNEAATLIRSAAIQPVH